MDVKKRSTIIASLLCIALLVATATVGAATINGTAGNDTLRGGAKADKLNGKGGNDKLFGAAGNDVLGGGPGNDLLVGGPGADRLSCGAGQDTARADSKDKVGADCEKVTGIPVTPPTPPPPPPPPAPPPPPPASPVTAGNYKGLMDGNFVFFTINSDRTISGFRSNYIREDCDQGGYVYGTVDWGPPKYPIANDGTFSFSADYDGTVEDAPAKFSDGVTGRVDGTNVTGTYRATADFTYQGTHYTCSSGQRTWTATIEP